MYTAEYEGINSFLVGASKLLLNEGIPRKVRNQICKELPEPCIFKIKNPTARLITINERKWNPILPYAESLWLAEGRNDLKFITNYLKKLTLFSDDGIYLRGGYGPRLRFYNGNIKDYKIDNRFSIDNLKASESIIDQFKYIEQLFKKDVNTRQGIISIGDPLKDCFGTDGDLIKTKDYPCTRLLHFQKQSNNNKLNLTVYMRSNDYMWGASAVNIFNYTYILEYFSKMLNLEIGNYYHVVNNFHYYDKHEEKLKRISKIKNVTDYGFDYKKTFNNIIEFNNLLENLKNEEEKLRNWGKTKLVHFEDDFFDDWYKTFYIYNTKNTTEFKNPHLLKLFKKYIQ